jgi:hypothetical protein
VPSSSAACGRKALKPAPKHSATTAPWQPWLRPPMGVRTSGVQRIFAMPAMALELAGQTGHETPEAGLQQFVTREPRVHSGGAGGTSCEPVRSVAEGKRVAVAGSSTQPTQATRSAMGATSVFPPRRYSEARGVPWQNEGWAPGSFPRRAANSTPQCSARSEIVPLHASHGHSVARLARSSARWPTARRPMH